MNLYVVVEGEKTESLVYKKWIRYINPKLRHVESLQDLQNNNFIIYAGYGHPFYFDVIDSAIEDINNSGLIDRLVISVDSEDMSYQEKYDEINSHINSKHCDSEIFIIVQHYCFESWALGNKSIISRNSQDELLRKYVDFYNVVENDPELMPAFANLNRSQFSYRYLRKAVNEKYRNLTYSKSNPKILLNRKYFEKIKNRYLGTGHISSFSNFLEAFK